MQALQWVVPYLEAACRCGTQENTPHVQDGERAGRKRVAYGRGEDLVMIRVCLSEALNASAWLRMASGAFSLASALQHRFSSGSECPSFS